MSKKTQGQQQNQSATVAASPAPAKPAAALSAAAPAPTSFIVRKGGRYANQFGAFVTVKDAHIVHLRAYGADEVARMRRAGIQLDPLE